MIAIEGNSNCGVLACRMVPECARPRAQQRTMKGSNLRISMRALVRELLRPGTGAPRRLH